MKKKNVFMLVLAICVSLVACDSGEEASSDGSSEKKETSQTKKNGMTKEELVDEITQVELASVKSIVEGKTTIKANSQDFSTSFNMEVDVTAEPNVMHMDMSTVDGDMEIYLGEDLGYILVPGEGRWISGPREEVYDTSEGDVMESYKLYNQVLNDHIDLFNMEEESGTYTLTLDNSDLNDKRIFDFLEQTYAANGMSMEFDTLSEIEYKLEYNEHFHLTNLKTNVISEITDENGESSSLKIYLKADYEVNNIDKLEIPAEIVENAINYEDLETE
ncbi:hypothetical protein LC087_03720 [Bacillus carboniphilus]|uniref:Lipoprotein n=1 Tax=Bacillus carboniphilus TaxID=86663 RepID=A0ABY9JY90_9BACI|nr:DUF6612 family protein [Bacillus carboniphilus]WLR43308.1 hypothetical protein LC087_03720 [Bacillus carboniphilus]